MFKNTLPRAQNIDIALNLTRNEKYEEEKKKYAHDKKEESRQEMKTRNMLEKFKVLY